MKKKDVFGFINKDVPIPGGFSAIPDEKRAEIMEEIDRVSEMTEEEDQLPGQMTIYDYPEVMPQQTTERRGRAETEDLG